MYINLSAVLIKKRNSKEIQCHLTRFVPYVLTKLHVRVEVSHEQDWTIFISLLGFFNHQNQFFPIFSLLWHIFIVNDVIPSIAPVCETVPGSVRSCLPRN